MPAYQYHHYVPRFLLKAWHTGPDNRLTRLRWARGQIEARRKPAKSVAAIDGLYSVAGTSAPNVVEQTFLRHVDECAAVVHRIFLGPPGQPLPTTVQRVDWSRFLVSLMLRTPAMIKHIRHRGALAMAGELERLHDDVEGPGDDDNLSAMAEWVAANVPDLNDNLGVLTLPALIASDKLNSAILGAHWQVRQLSRSPANLLIGDNPLIYRGTMAKKFVLALPLSPTRCFLAFNDPLTRSWVDQMSPWRIARTLNKDTLANAQEHVFATGNQHFHLASRYLRRPT